MKLFKFLLLLVLPILGNTQSYISSSFSFKENFLVTPRKLSINIINIYDNVIYHNVNNQIVVYTVTEKLDLKNETMYKAWNNGIQYQITVKPGEIIFHKVFSNQSVIYYYETY